MAVHPKSSARRNKLDMKVASRAAPRVTRRNNVSRTAAEDAVRTLLRWAGEDPQREGLLDTPKRVVDAYTDWFSGYAIDPRDYLRRTFEETGGYDEMVVLRDIEFESHCEHHMAPIIGRAHVGYLPTGKVVGISKLARVVMHSCAASITTPTPWGCNTSLMQRAISAVIFSCTWKRRA